MSGARASWWSTWLVAMSGLTAACGDAPSAALDADAQPPDATVAADATAEDGDVAAAPDSAPDATEDVAVDARDDDADASPTADDADASPTLDGDPGDADAVDASDNDGEDATPWVAPFPPVTCGTPDYAWLPPSAVGAVVATDEDPVFGTLDAATVDAFLAQVGFSEYAPVPYGVRNFPLRYTTQDHGATREATAVVAYPTGLTPSDEVPLVLWLHPTSGFTDACAPSAMGLEGLGAAALLASLGYVVVAPDFLGMLGFGEPSPSGTIHPYLVPEPTALVSLDAVTAARRALASYADAPAVDVARTALMGASQGGNAVFWVDRYAPHYAPDLHIVAAVAAVPPIDGLGEGRYAVTHLEEPTFAFAGALTAAHAWWGAPPTLEGALASGPPLDPAHTLPGILTASCNPSFDRSAVDDVSDVFEPSFITAIATGDRDAALPWTCYLAESSLAASSIPRANDTPYFVSFGASDTLVVADVELAAVSDLCQQGYRIVSVECAGEGHVGAAEASLPALFAFMRDRLAGVPLAPETVCQPTSPIDCSGL